VICNRSLSKKTRGLAHSFTTLDTRVTEVIHRPGLATIAARKATAAQLARWATVASDSAQTRDQYAALLPLYDKIHGPDHPDTLAVRANLANWSGLARDL